MEKKIKLRKKMGRQRQGRPYFRHAGVRNETQVCLAGGCSHRLRQSYRAAILEGPLSNGLSVELEKLLKGKYMSVRSDLCCSSWVIPDQGQDFQQLRAISVRHDLLDACAVKYQCSSVGVPLIVFCYRLDWKGIFAFCPFKVRFSLALWASSSLSILHLLLLLVTIGCLYTMPWDISESLGLVSGQFPTGQGLMSTGPPDSSKLEDFCP